MRDLMQICNVMNHFYFKQKLFKFFLLVCLNSILKYRNLYFLEQIFVKCILGYK